jgi:hypothetical protein
MGYLLLRGYGQVRRKGNRGLQPMSQDTDVIAEQIINRLKENDYGHAEILYCVIEGYLQKIRELKESQ